MEPDISSRLIPGCIVPDSPSSADTTVCVVQAGRGGRLALVRADRVPHGIEHVLGANV